MCAYACPICVFVSKHMSVHMDYLQVCMCKTEDRNVQYLVTLPWCRSILKEWELCLGLHVTLYVALLSPFGILTICCTWHSVSPCRKGVMPFRKRLDSVWFYEVQYSNSNIFNLLSSNSNFFFFLFYAFEI